MQDKTIRAILFGKSAELEYPKGRTQKLSFPGVGDQPASLMEFYSDDGCILYLLHRIEKMEESLKRFK